MTRLVPTTPDCLLRVPLDALYALLCVIHLFSISSIHKVIKTQGYIDPTRQDECARSSEEDYEVAESFV